MLTNAFYVYSLNLPLLEVPPFACGNSTLVMLIAAVDVVSWRGFIDTLGHVGR